MFLKKNVGLDLENLSQLYLDTLSLALTTEPRETTKYLSSSVPHTLSPQFTSSSGTWSITQLTETWWKLNSTG